jgi:phospholipid/cholesterol/gamma-HCH transport system substrate-binding protein
MKLSSVVSLGAIAAVLVIGIGYLTFGVVRVDWFNDYTNASMTLTNSGSLGARSPVLLSGIKVGEITSVDNTKDGVDVKFKVDNKYKIPTDSTLVVENLSALGEPYVQFTPTAEGGPYLKEGQQIQTSAIQMPLSIPDVARTVTNLMNQLDPEAISSLINTFDQGLSGADKVVPQLARSTSLLAATLLIRSQPIRSVLTDLQAIASDMDWTGPSMAAAGPLWGGFGDKISEAAAVLTKIINTGNTPAMYLQGKTAWFRSWAT